MKVTPLTGEAREPKVFINHLFKKGCGAFVGHEGCNAEPLPFVVVVNDPLSFLLYRTVNGFSSGMSLVFLCERHSFDVRLVTRDMDAALLRNQQAEIQKWFKKDGIKAPPPGVLDIISMDEFSKWTEEESPNAR